MIQYDDSSHYGNVMNKFCLNDGEITPVIPIDEELEQIFTTSWFCNIYRTLKPDLNGQVKINTRVTMYARSSVRFFTGFFKISITDKDGNTLPGQIKYAYVDCDSRNEIKGYSATFDELKPSENSEDLCFVYFELYIAIAEKETPDFNLPANDLSLLLEEPLLTDTVIRVHGREIPVHRALLAARWPRFYGRFLAGSNDSVVNVDEIEGEVLEKLLKYVYSNRIPATLRKDPACKDMAHIFEPIWLSGASQSGEQQQHSRSSSTNIEVADLDELRDFYPDQPHEIEVSVQRYIQFRCFSYTTSVAIEAYRQPTFALTEIFNTEFYGEDGNTITATWELYMANFDAAQYDGRDYCHLKLIDLKNASSVMAQTRFCILNCQGENHIELTMINQFNSNYETRFHLDYTLMNKLTKRSIKHHLNNGDITICLDIDIQVGADDLDDLDDLNLVDDLASQLNMMSSDDLGSLLVDGHLSDFVLRVGDREFSVHRAILAARSPVFRNMFTSQSMESVADGITIEDMEPDAMKELLRCVYTDQVPVEFRYDMLIAFDRFGLISLLDRYQDSLTITAENAFEMFAAAEELNAKRLKMRILKFLKNREAHIPHKSN